MNQSLRMNSGTPVVEPGSSIDTGMPSGARTRETVMPRKHAPHQNSACPMRLSASTMYRTSSLAGRSSDSRSALSAIIPAPPQYTVTGVISEAARGYSVDRHVVARSLCTALVLDEQLDEDAYKEFSSALFHCRCLLTDGPGIFGGTPRAPCVDHVGRSYYCST